MKFFRSGKISAISGEISSRSLKSPLDLRDLTGSSEILLNLVRFRQIWRISSDIPTKISPKFRQFRRWLAGFWSIFRSQSLTELTAIRWRLDQPDPINTPVGGGLKIWISDLVGSVLGWAQTQPGLTCGHA